MDDLDQKKNQAVDYVYTQFLEETKAMKREQDKLLDDFELAIENEEIKNLKDNINKT